MAGARHILRKIMYQTPVGRPLSRIAREIQDPPEHETPGYWDAGLTGGLAAYRGGTLSVAVRDALTVTLIRYLMPAASLLDFGCAVGSLGRAAWDPSLRRYVGVDISPAAIRDAQTRAYSSDASFVACNLCDFSSDERFDAIVFKEVLYYLEPDAAATQFTRVFGYLNPGGLLVVSMKDDPKSHAVLSACRRDVQLVKGVLHHEQTPRSSGWRLRRDPARPPFLIAAMKPSL